MIDPILARHGRILSVIDRLEAMVAGPRPAQVDELAELRWSFTREVLLHCSEMSELFVALMADRRADAVTRARLADARTRQFVVAFHEHVGHWYGLPPTDRWVEYRASIETLAAMLRRLVDGEAGDIVPVLPLQPGGAAVPASSQRYAEEAWDVRQMIFDANQRPFE